MKEIQTVIYQTCDLEEFKNKEEAISHEQEVLLTLAKKVSAICKKYSSCSTCPFSKKDSVICSLSGDMPSFDIWEFD